MKDVTEIFEEDVEVTEIELDKVEVETLGSSTADLTEDYNFVREKLIRSMVRGSELIDESLKEAKTSPTPRAIEAATGATKALTEVSKALIDLHEKMKNISKNPNSSNNLDSDEDDNDNIVLKTSLSDLLEKINAEC